MPIVPVPKGDGTVRICGDFKVTVNPSLYIDKYPIPNPQDLLAVLAGGKKFTKLDLSQAYQQMVLDSADQKYTTINTHLGFFRYKRLPYGIASAPAIFQQTMEKILQGIPGVVCYIDDVLVTEEKHLQNLAEVLKWFEERGLRLKLKKCFFMQTRVEYLGYIINADGLHTSPDKVKAVTETPEPQN